MPRASTTNHKDVSHTATEAKSATPPRPISGRFNSNSMGSTAGPFRRGSQLMCPILSGGALCPPHSPPLAPRIHLPHTGSALIVPGTSWLVRLQSWAGDWAPPRLRMCARVLVCLQLSRIAFAPDGLLATMCGLYDAFVYQHFPHRPAQPNGPSPILPRRASRFSARLVVLNPDHTSSTTRV